jgi:two-component system, NtrC family, response regulator AtoC
VVDDMLRLSMANVDALVTKAAPTLINVLLLGETGVGKGVMAERLHRTSTRAGGPFLQLNCAGLSAALLESELFGHERGAFTGAMQARKGLLEEAAGGTVFLDEIGEMPLEVQAHLLLAIDQRVARRVGANRSTPIDVRFISATHRDLGAEISGGRFREDFYYRINGLTIRIPPLRERRGEIEGLIQQFATEAAARLRRDLPPDFDEDARERLQSHDWPGNIRELRSVIESAVLFAEGNLVTSYVLTAAGLSSSAPSVPPAEGSTENQAATGGATGNAKCERVIEVLSECGGNQSRAARLLGVSRNTLIRLICLYNLPRPRGKKD